VRDESDDYPTDGMQSDLYDDTIDDDDDDGLDDDYADEEDGEEDPEQLPDPKGLVSVPDEEEDMGYDEDDERIAMERPRTVVSMAPTARTILTTARTTCARTVERAWTASTTTNAAVQTTIRASTVKATT